MPDSADVIERARAHVEALASPEMHGRGYLYDGHEQAALYIRRQYREMGAAPVGNSYFQPFVFEVGLFPEAPRLMVNGRSLVLGEEFLPAEIGSSGRSVQPVPIAAASQQSSEGRAVITAGRDAEAIERAAEAGATAVIVLLDVLSYSPRASAVHIPVFYVARSAWPEQSRTIRYDMSRIDKTVIAHNVLARIEGTARPDSTIILMAHYDHLGSLGEDNYFAGANDNASGVALLLSLAHYYSNYPPDYTMVFAAFSGEEEGLVGSRYFARRPPIDLDRVAFLINFDMVASGEDGITALGGIPFDAAYQRLLRVNSRLDLGPLSKRAIAPNSDHWYLMKQGVPGFFLYTKDGSQPYHHVRDVPSTLDWHDLWHVYALARGFLESFGNGRD